MLQLPELMQIPSKLDYITFSSTRLVTEKLTHIASHKAAILFPSDWVRVRLLLIGNKDPQSILSQLPAEVVKCIISFVDVMAENTLGREDQQRVREFASTS